MNKVILMGRVARDPEVRTSNDGVMMARYTLAVDRRVRRDADNNQQTTDFIGCVAFGKGAEFAEKYMTKGRRFLVEGRIQTGSYTNREGQKIYTTDVIVENQEFADSKAEAPASAPATNNTQAASQANGFMNIPDGVGDAGLPFN